jgi:hypothetical protein
MDYIINPSWFYWLQVLSAVRVIFIVAMVISIIAAIGTAIGAIYNYCEWKDCGYDDNEQYFHTCIKVIKPCVIVAIITTLIVIFMPSKDTMISMMIAKFATKTNAQWTLDALKSAVDYVIQGIQKLKG